MTRCLQPKSSARPRRSIRSWRSTETPMDEVRSAGIAMVLMQGIVFAEIAKKIDGPSEELNERIATFNHDLKAPLQRTAPQEGGTNREPGRKAGGEGGHIRRDALYREHTDPADIRIAEGSTSMTGALMAAAMASYDLSCGLIDDDHIGRYSDVITALEERRGSVPADSPSRPRRASSSPTPRRTASASASTSPAAMRGYRLRRCGPWRRRPLPTTRSRLHLQRHATRSPITAPTASRRGHGARWTDDCRDPAHVPADITAAANEAAAKSVKPDTVGTDGIKH